MRGKFSFQLVFCFLLCISNRYIYSFHFRWTILTSCLLAASRLFSNPDPHHFTVLPNSRQDEGDSHLLFQSVTDESVTRCVAAVGRFLRPVNDHLDNSTSAGPVVTWSRAHIPFPVHCTHPLSSPLTTASGRGRVGYLMLFNISTLYIHP